MKRNRTQEGDLGNRDALCTERGIAVRLHWHANRTGRRSTPRAFGRELSTDDTGVTKFERYIEPRYSIADSIRDGATLRLVWEPSPRDWKLFGKHSTRSSS